MRRRGRPGGGERGGGAMGEGLPHDLGGSWGIIPRGSTVTAWCTPVDTYITHVHNMNVSQNRGLPNGGLVGMSMRRAIIAATTALVTASLPAHGGMRTGQRSSGRVPRRRPNGIGPITFAVGGDDADIFAAN